MAILATAKGDNGKTFQPAPEGVHQAVCVDVQDLGWLNVTWQGVTKTQHKVNIAWQIAEDRDDGKPYLVFKRYTLSLHEKSGLRKDLESWLGRKITESGFDVESVIGMNCLLNVTHNRVGERTYANVASVMPLHKRMPPMQARDYVRKVDRATPEAGGSQAQDHDEMNPPPLSDDDLSAIPF